MAKDPLSLEDATAQLTAAGQLFETEDATIGGRSLTIWKHAPANLVQLLDLSLQHATKDFLVYEDRRYTFDEHYRVVATFATRLLELGVKKGDRVAVAARNLPEWAMAFWGAVITGAVVVPLNAWWTPDELVYGLNDSGSTVLVLDEERLDRLEPRLGEISALTHVIVIGERRTQNPAPRRDRVALTTFVDLLGDVDPEASPPEVDIAPEDDATMLYTSGTTGQPKGAVGTHRNIITNVMNLGFAATRSALRFRVDDGRPSVQNTALINIPFFHATGCHAFLIPATAGGTKIVMTHHFDPAVALRLIESERVTGIGGVPTVAMQILDHPDFERYDTSSVTSVSYGGAPAPPDLVARLRVAFPKAQPSNGYGLTETCAAVCNNSGADYAAKPASCGPPYPVNELAIVPEGYLGEEPSDERPRGPEVIGELWIKGPNVIRGYWNKPEATAESFTSGWLHTGDIARIDDDGFVFIVDRSKDMIIRGGENVYSVIVEGAIFEHPDVADCAVVGLAHPTLGEEVAAIIVLHPGRVVEGEEISRHVARRLAKFEVPTTIVFRSTPLPRNPQGKVLKRELRESLNQSLRPS